MNDLFRKEGLSPRRWNSFPLPCTYEYKHTSPSPPSVDVTSVSRASANKTGRASKFCNAYRRLFLPTVNVKHLDISYITNCRNAKSKLRHAVQRPIQHNINTSYLKRGPTALNMHSARGTIQNRSRVKDTLRDGSQSARGTPKTSVLRQRNASLQSRKPKTPTEKKPPAGGNRERRPINKKNKRSLLSSIESTRTGKAKARSKSFSCASSGASLNSHKTVCLPFVLHFSL